MNMSVRALDSTNAELFEERSSLSFAFSISESGILTLLFAVLLSALALIYFKDLNRCLFINYQETAQVTERLIVEHDQLMLEASAWASPPRVQQIATEKWNMRIPSPEEVVLLDAS
ncbi:MAG: cell division protein FtsL [Gammaproteobacteria bacterium]